MENLLLEFSQEAVIIHPEPFLTDHGSRVLAHALSNPIIVKLIHYPSLLYH